MGGGGHEDKKDFLGWGGWGTFCHPVKCENLVFHITTETDVNPRVFTFAAS